MGVRERESVGEREKGNVQGNRKGKKKGKSEGENCGGVIRICHQAIVTNPYFF